MSSRSDKEAHTEGRLERTEAQCWHQRLSGAGSVTGEGRQGYQMVSPSSKCCWLNELALVKLIVNRLHTNYN